MKRIKTFISEKKQEKDIEFFLFVLFFIFIIIYYAIRIFNKAPWYDELYTYFYFISKGPVYSAIHWPVPNNHIGYSVLSGILYVITHNGFIALRGISFVAAALNIILLFMTLRLIMTKGFSIAAVSVYSGMWLVNNLSVQGRGYTLATTMMLMCIYCMVRIVLDENPKKRFYVFWMIGLFMGFYTVTSSLYWVVPICLCAGLCLLIFKKYKELIRLIAYSVIAACITAFLYLVVWLAIGSNLLINEVTEYFGLGHVKLILSHPLLSAKRGIDYMLASPYIQSVERKGYTEAFCNHWNTLLGQLYDLGYVLPIGILIAVIISVIMIISFFAAFKKGESEKLLGDLQSKKMIIISLLVCCLTVVTPLIVIIQCKLPYYRVFSFYGVGIAISLIFVLYIFFGKLKSYFVYSIPTICIVFAIAQLLSASYNDSYGYREQDAFDVLTLQDIKDYENVVVTDCDLEYMYKFIWDKECSTDISLFEASSDGECLLIVYNGLLDSSAEFSWENYYDFDTINEIVGDGILSQNNIKLIFANDNYSLFVKG